jgi:hypothetical protein
VALSSPGWQRKYGPEKAQGLPEGGRGADPAASLFQHRPTNRNETWRKLTRPDRPLPPASRSGRLRAAAADTSSSRAIVPFSGHGVKRPPAPASLRSGLFSENCTLKSRKSPLSRLAPFAPAPLRARRGGGAQTFPALGRCSTGILACGRTAIAGFRSPAPPPRLRPARRHRSHPQAGTHVLRRPRRPEFSHGLDGSRNQLRRSIINVKDRPLRRTPIINVKDRPLRRTLSADRIFNLVQGASYS